MARQQRSKITNKLSHYGQLLYQWLGITAGSISDVPGNHMRVGEVFLRREEPQEALKRFKLAAWLRRGDPAPYALMVQAHMALGQKALALAACAEAKKRGYGDMQSLEQSLQAMDTPPVEANTQTAAEQGVDAG